MRWSLTRDTDPRSAEEAGAFVRKLQNLLRRVGAGDGDMEKVCLPCDRSVLKLKERGIYVSMRMSRYIDPERHLGLDARLKTSTRFDSSNKL